LRRPGHTGTCRRCGGRGLHSFTFQNNVSAFRGIGGVFRGRLGGVLQMLGVLRGVWGVPCVRNGSGRAEKWTSVSPCVEVGGGARQLSGNAALDRVQPAVDSIRGGTWPGLGDSFSRVQKYWRFGRTESNPSPNRPSFRISLNAHT